MGRRSYRRANERAERGSRGQRCVSARHAHCVPRITHRRGFPRAPAHRHRTPNARSGAATAVRRPAAAPATPLEGVQRRMRPTRASGACQTEQGRTASTSWGPARCSCRRSRSSPLCKRAETWQSLVSSRGWNGVARPPPGGSRKTTGSTATAVRGANGVHSHERAGGNRSQRTRTRPIA